MQLFVKLLGIIIIAGGIACVLLPQTLKDFLLFWTYGKRLYGAGLIRLTTGIIFLLVASKATVPWIIIILGILQLLSGILIFKSGLPKSRTVLEWWIRRQPRVLRVAGGIMMLFGILIVYAV